MPETVVHFQIRMPPILHEQLASWAKEDKASLNALIVGILEKASHAAKSSSRSQGRSRQGRCAVCVERPGPPPPGSILVHRSRGLSGESALSRPARGSVYLVVPNPR